MLHPNKKGEITMTQEYYMIDEVSAKRAKEMNSYSAYKEGSATTANIVP